jgi:GTPase SAR1 family protein
MNLLHTDIPYPGLTPACQEIPKIFMEIAKRRAALHYKKSQHCPWVVFLGGTGTGKSTLFNAFCGKSISNTGVERPKTTGPILYAPTHCTVSSGLGVTGIKIEERSEGQWQGGTATGYSDRLLILTHKQPEDRPLVVVDTPDLDSVEGIHRNIAEDFYLLADAVVFVASPEKYADETPCRFLAKVIEENRPLFFLLNKVQEPFGKAEIFAFFDNQGISLPQGRIWLIPYQASHQQAEIAKKPAFQAFVAALLDEVRSDGGRTFRKDQMAQRTQDVAKRARGLLRQLEEEVAMSKRWLDRLSELCSRISVGLLKKEKHRFLTESSGEIQREVKTLFSKYDVLAKPRRFIRSVLRTPLEVLGVLKARTHKGQKKALSEVRGKIAFTPILRTVDHFNHQVLALLSPKDPSSPLFDALRKPSVTMTEDEIKTMILKEQDTLDRWLEDRFQRLAHDLPKSKKWGIYSTSILWGVLILSFEVIVGGGFTVLDAAIDSVIAPFVTKGAVGLFASREIRKIARELAQRYEQGLLSVIVQQKKRYEDCLKALLPSQQILDELRRPAV